MRRRDLSKVLLASAAGALAISSETQAQTCTPPCFPQTSAEATAGVTPTNYAYAPGNIRRYGAVGNGSTPDTAAVRQALDVAAVDGTTVTCTPPGLIKLNATVYIPQRIANVAQKGFLMEFHGSTFVGSGRGVGTMFETGTGSSSTAGATNFGQPAEGGTALHYGTIVAGARFRGCEIAIKLFNFTKGCKLEDLFFEDVDTCVKAERSFYMELHNCHAQIQNIGSGRVLFDFSGVNNAITVSGCEAGGGAGNTTGIGYRFTGAGAGIIFHNNTAESLSKGLVINSAISGIDIRQSYFESLATTGIDASAGGAKTMDVNGNWFLGCTKGIVAREWIAGTYGGSNTSPSNDPVEIADADSMCTVEIPLQILAEAAADASAQKLPGHFTLSKAVVLRGPRMVYVASAGLAAPIAIDAGTSTTVPAFYYSGGNLFNGAGYNIPFVTLIPSNGFSTLDTQITWSDYRMIVVFDLYAAINGSGRRLRGLVFAGGAVQRFDSEPLTVTASNNGGNLRLTVAGTAHNGVVATGFHGQIRHM